MKALFVNYPKCSTCVKAKKFLIEHNIEFEDRHIVEDNPTKEDLREWLGKSGLTVNKFFNTSGILYREMNLKEKVKTASEEELLEILSTNGMLVKRPVLVLEDRVLVGFRNWEKEFE